MDRDMELTADFYKKERHAPEQTARRSESGADHEAEPERKPATGFSVGINFFLDYANEGAYPGHLAFQFGIVHSRPIIAIFDPKTAALSLDIAGDIFMGKASYPQEYGDYYQDNPNFGIFGVDAPVMFSLRRGVVSVEAGVHAGLLFGGGETLFNAGLAAGAGVGFSKNHSRRYFYRYSGGYNYGAHIVGMRWLF